MKELMNMCCDTLNFLSEDRCWRIEIQTRNQRLKRSIYDITYKIKTHSVEYGNKEYERFLE
jgi:hypothetical protein